MEYGGAGELPSLQARTDALARKGPRLDKPRGLFFFNDRVSNWQSPNSPGANDYDALADGADVRNRASEKPQPSLRWAGAKLFRYRYAPRPAGLGCTDIQPKCGVGVKRKTPASAS
jgi:hypothetical protein